MSGTSEGPHGAIDDAAEAKNGEISLSGNYESSPASTFTAYRLEITAISDVKNKASPLGDVPGRPGVSNGGTTDMETNREIPRPETACHHLNTAGKHGTFA